MLGSCLYGIVSRNTRNTTTSESNMSLLGKCGRVMRQLTTSHGGHVHDKLIADATPYPLPAESRLLLDLGFLVFTLPQVAILMSAKKPCGEELTRE